MKIIGWLMILSFFIGLFSIITMERDLRTAFESFGFAFSVAGFLIIGIGFTCGLALKEMRDVFR